MIRYPERIDQILEIMGRAWKTVPDYRLCQLMVNLFGTDPFYVEDDKVAQTLEMFAEGSWRKVQDLDH